MLTAINSSIMKTSSHLDLSQMMVIEMQMNQQKRIHLSHWSLIMTYRTTKRLSPKIACGNQHR
jgi:hypothetical protein